jgi:hypothetical protein
MYLLYIYSHIGIAIIKYLVSSANCSAFSTSDKMDYMLQSCFIFVLVFCCDVFVMQQVINVIGSGCVSVPEPLFCLHSPCLCSCKRSKLINK